MTSVNELCTTTSLILSTFDSLLKITLAFWFLWVDLLEVAAALWILAYLSKICLVSSPSTPPNLAYSPLVFAEPSADEDVYELI